MIKQVWVAVNPNDPQDMIVELIEPPFKEHKFGEFGFVLWKPAMLIVEDT